MTEDSELARYFIRYLFWFRLLNATFTREYELSIVFGEYFVIAAPIIDRHITNDELLVAFAVLELINNRLATIANQLFRWFSFLYYFNTLKTLKINNHTTFTVLSLTLLLPLNLLIFAVSAVLNAPVSYFLGLPFSPFSTH